MRLRTPVGLLLMVLTLPLLSCTTQDANKNAVQAALDQTQALARSFVYTELASGQRTQVSGAIADDLRYRLQESINGAPAADQVVFDDRRALQVRNTAVLLGLAGGTSNLSVPPSLAGGAWVVDKTGAASLTLRSALQQEQVGQNEMMDALTIFGYVRTAITDALMVVKWNPDSSSYRPKLDSFPAPGPGVVRYDLLPPNLPPHSQGGLDSLQQIPNVAFFRQLSVYVQDGRVIDVRERISVEVRLDDSLSNLEARLGDFVKAPANASTAEQAQLLTAELNKRLKLTNQPLIRPRTLDVKFGPLGAGPTVELPSGATEGDLSSLGTLNQVLYETR